MICHNLKQEDTKMPKLNCFVELCKYQKEGFCSARSIDVANFTALTSDETTCATYVPIQVSSEKSTHHAIEEISINCDATYCLHNNNQL
ncbi:MAG: DUF1540 domain-containing protein, partial [Clostridiaceae bacterium]|nr:DUF1540 domain-containing protein [Clostridiaceae bacterium]